MRITYLLLTFMMTLQLATAQDELVTWEFTLNEAGDAIDIKAVMQDAWVIYSQHTEPDGPIPLEFEFIEISGAELAGPVEELSSVTEEFCDMFEVNVSKFKKEALFRQALKSEGGPVTIKGTVTFMTCDDTRCLPPETVPFEIN